MNISITSWNINGIRARAEAMKAWITANQPDVLCLQELKATEDQIPPDILSLSDTYDFFWNGSTFKKGYSGTGALVKKTMLNSLGTPSAKLIIPDFDIENRVVEVAFGDFSVIGVYTPRGEKDEHYDIKLNFLTSLSKYMQKRIKEQKHVVLCGDMNVAHQNIDVFMTDIDDNAVGLRPPEREAITNLLNAGVLDTFRHLYPDLQGAYTWWPYWRGAREKNLGWRIDCFYTSPKTTKNVKDVVIYKDEKSSDHSPVSLIITP